MATSTTFSFNHGHFLNIFQHEKFSDVTIVCEGEMIKCHKILLAAASNYFDDLFTMLPDTNHSVIVLKDIKKNHLAKVFEYIYCGKITIHPNDMREFRELAEYFKLKIEFPPDDDDDDESDFNDSVPEMMSQSILSQEIMSQSLINQDMMSQSLINHDIMSQETTVGNLTMENFQISNEFDDFDEDSNDSEDTLVSRTSSIKLAKDKRFEPVLKKAKLEYLQAENKIKCQFCQKYVPERLSNDHQKHCFKNRNRQPLKCNECRQDFEVSTRLRNHIIKMHPAKQPKSLF